MSPVPVTRGAALPSLLAVTVLARLRTPFDGGLRLNVFDGEPIDVEHDQDGRAHPYAAFYDSPGNLSSSGLAEAIFGPGSADEVAWSFQVTCAGGDPDRCRRAVERVRSLLTGHPLDVPDLATPGATRTAGWCLETPGYDPGPARVDRDIQPSRYYVPLLWTVTAA